MSMNAILDPLSYIIDQQLNTHVKCRDNIQDYMSTCVYQNEYIESSMPLIKEWIHWILFHKHTTNMEGW